MPPKQRKARGFQKRRHKYTQANIPITGLVRRAISSMTEMKHFTNFYVFPAQAPTVMDGIITLASQQVDVTPTISVGNTNSQNRIGNRIHMESVRLQYTVYISSTPVTAITPITVRVLVFQSPEPVSTGSVITENGGAAPKNIFGSPEKKLIKLISDKIHRLSPYTAYQAGHRKIKKIPRRLAFEKDTDTQPNYKYTAVAFYGSEKTVTDTVVVSMGVEYLYRDF